ncbi:MAG TPA: BrnT family toxin [Nitrosomonas halophila]|nr:BrnT family toxin [Nitrosomonas halophila]
MLVVVHTWRKDRVRIISARKASRSEVKNYHA